jgi:hypothetical protein
MFCGGLAQCYNFGYDKPTISTPHFFEKFGNIADKHRLFIRPVCPIRRVNLYPATHAYAYVSAYRRPHCRSVSVSLAQ